MLYTLRHTVMLEELKGCYILYKINCSKNADILKCAVS